MKRNVHVVLLAMLCSLLMSSSALGGSPTENDNNIGRWQHLPSPIATNVYNEYIIDFEDDVDNEEVRGLLRTYGLSGTHGPSWDSMKMVIVSVKPGDQAALNKIRNHSNVETVEPRSVMRALFVPNDPLFEDQWHMSRVQATDAWSRSIGRGVVVAIIDTGVACEDNERFHKITDLKQTKCVAGYNAVADDNNAETNESASDDHGHGTHVAGTVAQSTNNNFGGVGMAFGVSIMPVKVLSGEGWGTNDGVAAGIRWAADNGAQVINMSLGGSHPSEIIEEACNYAHSKGVVIVAAAGNGSGPVGYPAAFDHVIAVSATDQDDKMAWFSDSGEEVDIGAPGVDVTQQTICDEGRNGCEEFGTYNGTSMATPHVAGAAALIMSLGVTDPDKVEEILKNSAKKLDNDASGHQFGAGLLQASDAVDNVVITQNLIRIIALFLLSMLTFGLARQRGETFPQASPAYWATGIATGVGALFFAPWMWSRHHLWVDVFSRPFAEWDIFFGVSVHEYLPLATVFVPLAVAACCLKLHEEAGVWISGLFVGTAAYMTSVVILDQMVMPFGWLPTIVWRVANIALCVYIGALLLVKPNTSAVAERVAA